MAWNTAEAGEPAADTLPNVLVILLDDIGLDQLAMYADENQYPASDPYEYAATPNLDAIAQSGVRFTQARANPLCSPTRALINSGRYAFRSGVGSIVRMDNTSPAFAEFSIVPAPNENTLPETPELAGYESAWIGKWHLGLESSDGGSGDEHPERVGWMQFIGAMRNLNQQPNPGPIEIGGEWVGPGYNHWYRVVDGRRTVETTYATIKQREDCQEWILSQGQEPWCAVLAFSACHSPYDWPPDGTHSFPDLFPSGNDVLWDHYRAMLESVDHEIGELLFALGPLLDDTLIMVVGDNGTPQSVFESAREEGQDLGAYDTLVDQDRLKGSLYELGIRVPLIVSGPGVVQPGRSSAQLVDVVDIHSTLREFLSTEPFGSSGGPRHKDSRSFWRLLRDPAAQGVRRFSFAERFDPNGDWPSSGVALRAFSARILGDGHLYKLVRRPGNFDEVYDLTDDPLELTDLSVLHPAYLPLATRLLTLVGN